MSDPDDETSFPVRTAAGIGGLLAAGLIGLLVARRRQQRRVRTAGRRLPVPEGYGAQLEQTLHDIADPLGADIVDLALRSLATGGARSVPRVRAARLTGDQLELHLAEPVRLPEPWRGTSDETVWVLPADVDTARLLDTPVVRGTPAPYPALVTVGHDSEGGHVLVDLEYAGVLDIRGPEPLAREVVTALGVELVTTQWADGVSIAAVGVCEELEQALGVGRLRYFDDIDGLLRLVEVHADADRHALRTESVTSAAEARARGADAGEWSPEIVLVGSQLDPGQRRRLDAVVHDVPRVAIAAVTAGAESGTEWAVRFTSDDPEVAVLEPLGLPVAPQRLTGLDYAAVLDVLQTADAPPAGQPGLDPASEHVSDIGDEPDHDADADLGVDHPVIRLLGPVEVANARGPVDARHVGQLTEIAAYLALHDGATGDDLDQAIWPGEPNKKSSRAQACSRLRNWLGSDPDGNRYFPQMSGGRYRFSSSVRTDWELFCHLVPGDPHQVSTARLEAALSLVTGQPFTGAVGRRPKYRWADRLKQEMISAIADTAAVAAMRSLAADRPRQARIAAATGLEAEPGMEELWRHLLVAEFRAGNPHGVQEAAEQLELLLDGLGTEPEPETVAVLEQVLTPTAVSRPAT